MADSSYDCVVIGSGPGGYVAAIRAAQLGMKTAVVEKDSVGGRCLNYACIPAKAVLRVADVLSEVRDAGRVRDQGRRAEVDYAAVGAAPREGRLDADRRRLGPVQEERDRADRGRGLAGRRRRRSPSAAARSRPKTIVLATGSVKRPIPGTEFGGRVIGTEEAWALAELPKSMAVVGAGASGAEIASAYARLGVEVLLFEALDRVLPTEDADISKARRARAQAPGIDDPHRHARRGHRAAASRRVTFTLRRGPSARSSGS